MSGHRQEPSPRRLAILDGSATIRRRVARILALPALVVLILLGIVASQQITDFRSSQNSERSVRLTLAVQGLVHQLQTERGLAAAVLGGNPSFRNELATARGQVDAQRAAVTRLTDGDGDVETRLRATLQQLDGLSALRAAVDGSTAARAATFDYYTQRINALVGLDLGLERVADDELRRASSALRALMDLSEATAQERAFLNGVFSAGGFGKGEFIQFAAMRTARDAALAAFRRQATGSERAAADFVFDTGAARTSGYFEQVALSAADGRHVLVNPQSWWSGQTTVLDDVGQLQDHVGSTIQIRAHDLQTDSAARLAGLVLVVLLCLGGSVMLAVLASRSITRPLAALAAEADAVAGQRLPAAVRHVLTHPDDEHPTPPEPVTVPARATREISSVASALDRLQSAAYGLATEQALQRQRVVTSLANLGRRNQNLIRRQLGFITRLEREEMDPTALSNLFELDHLATRMRRNATSLLVLVGESGPRQWSSPVAMADVVRAAVSEVEEYRRVALRRVDEVLVAGSAVGAVVHLLSELVENALTFSPPDSEVEVQGRLFGENYLIAITDQGIGMSVEDLRVANARLKGEGDFIAAPTKFLGHFVVGELARTTGIDVVLVPSPVIGVTARITLPATLLTGRVAVEAGPTPRTPEPRTAKSALDPAGGPGPTPVPGVPALERAGARPAAPAGTPRLTAVGGSRDGAGDPATRGITTIDLTGPEPAAPGVRPVGLTAVEAVARTGTQDDAQAAGTEP
ncbi:MAG TPA: ATP-binding protein, partial [Kineosporiaceae bacterium]